MNTKTKIAALASVALTVTVVWQILVRGSEAALRERFPDIHPDDLKAAHKEMRRRAFAGELADVDTDDDEVMDHLFLSIVNNL